jgi:hypothetical protein
MTPEHEVHQPHAHRTGHRLLDLAVPVSALLISVVSLVIGIHHGRTMQEMAQANARLVQANSWPLLQYATGNANDNGDPEITMKIVNSGVGPAKLISLELFQGERRLRTPRDLVDALDPSHPRPALSLGITLPTVLRAGQDMLILGMKREGNVEALWDKLNQERFRFRFRACYCSVFDECWVSDLLTVAPQPIQQCTATNDSFTFLDTPKAEPPPQSTKP